ncbi:hypothetical protein BL250_05935 [Erwinia sp. OLTSP20]|uniref:hypothetical protein n=1 Tax=unclassified Erwinia TaxID=2622719 RepID=UPI000C637212|nr:MULTISPECIES: hypothetical protein [unclassified Erwinia]PIJ73955.1 hypothetical protein BK416_05670 [Erwinia sp. OLSSP12]PIJ83963.1 hypothetical protein BLD47_03295 [Erwinia sp. OLCASP19]PIJ86493.1 hypothetical protein BLD46_03575 [Erwinia sp. OLMTSP26]PIJ87972.1 hypothetical protein BLD49_04255 [Erwinia sp. OLMDSP33]PIJ90590.1 hypothetical protein BL249_12365 [Erwinia sp. OLFS4]
MECPTLPFPGKDDSVNVNLYYPPVCLDESLPLPQRQPLPLRRLPATGKIVTVTNHPQQLPAGGYSWPAKAICCGRAKRIARLRTVTGQQ